jgi:hypothetical protein
MHATFRAHAPARARYRIAALPLLLTFAFVPRSEAQLGGLVKKAKAAATGEAARRSGATAVLEGQPVAFNDVILELTDARLAQVIQGLQAGQANASAGSRTALVTKRNDLANQAAALMESHGKQIDDHNKKLWQVERCRNEAFAERNTARNAQVQKRAMTDAAFRDKIIALTTQLAQAQAKGDTAAYKALETQARALSGEGKADTVAVDAACGPLPAKHPIDVQIQALQAQASDLDDQIRNAEQQAAEDEAKAAGMNVQQFAMARERIIMYLARVKSNSQQRGFTTTELKALESQRSTLAGLV